MSNDDKCVLNTDRELFREGDGDGNGMSYYEPYLFVTIDDRIGIGVGGTVRVHSLREWHELAGGAITGPVPTERISWSGFLGYWTAYAAKHHQEQRHGQMLFNAMYNYVPDVANRLRGTDVDPFNADFLIPAFLDAACKEFDA